MFRRIACLTSASRWKTLAQALFSLVLCLAISACLFQPTITETDRREQDLMHIGLILPISSPRERVANVAQSFKNAAQMAFDQNQNPNITITIFDDAGTVAGAKKAAEEALEKHVDIIIGPLLAPSVMEVADLAYPKGVPVIAFSTDSNVAGKGVYLLSFLPESEVDRAVQFVADQQKRAFLGLLPASPYADAVSHFFRKSVSQYGGRIQGIDSYAFDEEEAIAVARRAAQSARGNNPSVNAIFIPDSGLNLEIIAQTLREGQVNFEQINVFSTGLWADDGVQTIPALDGGYFAAPDERGWLGFSQAYRRTFGSEPVRTTSLAYDAISLAVYLFGLYGPDAFDANYLTDSRGFSGIDGRFRFLPNGVNERLLAIYQIADGDAQIIETPPDSF